MTPGSYPEPWLKRREIKQHLGARIELRRAVIACLFEYNLLANRGALKTFAHCHPSGLCKLRGFWGMGTVNDTYKD